MRILEKKMNASVSTMLKRKRLFYNSNDDVVLLREIAGQNPYEDPNRWSLIEKNVREATCKDFTKRSMQDRAKILLERFTKKLQEDPFKSGIEEEVTELDDLLHVIKGLCEEFNKMKNKPKTPFQIGFERRQVAVQHIADVSDENFLIDDRVADQETITDDISFYEEDVQEEVVIINDDCSHKDKEEANKENVPVEIIRSEPKKKRIFESIARGRGRGSRTGVLSRGRQSLKYSSLNFMEKKNDRWYEIRKRELDLEEAKFILEKKEREQQIEMMKKRQVAELEMLNSQQKILELMTNVVSRLCDSKWEVSN